MEKPMNERMAIVENRLDQHDSRLNRHGDKIDGLQAENVKQNSMLEKLCTEQEKTHRKTQENGDKLEAIHTSAKTIQWLFGAAVAILSAYLTVKQLGIF